MPLLDIDQDATILEKSIRHGCKTVMVHSRPLDEGHRQIYELLADLASTEEINIKDFQISHCISTLSNTESTLKSQNVSVHICLPDPLLKYGLSK